MEMIMDGHFAINGNAEQNLDARLAYYAQRARERHNVNNYKILND